MLMKGAPPTSLPEVDHRHLCVKDALWTCKPSAFCWVLFLHEALARLPPVRGCCRSHLSPSRTCAGAAHDRAATDPSRPTACPQDIEAHGGIALVIVLVELG